MKAYLLDANVCLRFLLADDPGHSPKAKALFESAETGKIKLRLTPVAVAELVWVLHSHFEHPRAEVGAKLRGLVLHHGVETEGEDLILDALERFSRVNADFPDCYIAAVSAQTADPVATYDRDFRKFTDVVSLTPDSIIAQAKG